MGGRASGYECTFMRVLSAILLLAAAALAQTRHNVLLVVADDLGVDYVAAYNEGTNPPPTPTLSALAARGVLFRNAWANPSCSPTRACLQTGRYPFRTMVGRWIGHTQSPQNVGLLEQKEVTIPEVLDRAGSGYAHALVGKWHLHDAFAPADNPRRVGGYSHFAGLLEGQVPSYTNWTRYVNGVGTPTTTYCTTQVTDDAIAWIQAQTQPWVCVVTHQAPHIPYHAPPAHLHTQNLTGLTPQPTTHTPANIPFYRAMVQSLDTELGRLFATLGPALMAQTNVVFIADNGTVQQQSVAPFSGTRSKGTPYEGGVNVPLIVAGPAVVQGGREVGALACSTDVFRTVLELTGAASHVPPHVPNDSVSLVPYLTNPAQAPLRTFAYTEEFTGTAWPAPETNGHATIRNARFKLVRRFGGGASELFDLLNDPWELTNLFASSDPVVAQNRAALAAEIDRLRAQGATDDFGVYGPATCIGSSGVPTIGGSGSAVAGGSFTLTLAGAAPATFAFSSLGWSWQAHNGMNLPLSLAVVGANPGCMLSSSPDTFSSTLTSAAGTATRSTPVPANPALVDVSVFSSWVVLDRLAPANPAGIVCTNAIGIRIGT